MPSHPPFDLETAARQAMIDHGFEPDFPPRVTQDLAALTAHPPKPDRTAQDLRHLLWSSIDNDTSRDLDQVEYAERLPDGNVRVLIGIADVDLYVAKGSAIDEHAAT
jgi:exoribonuclease R